MSVFEMNHQPDTYDVVICGGGIAGQTLARQLKLNDPTLSILLLEKNTYPVPVAAHKVGESLIETSTYYLAQTLDLDDYLQENCFRKFGFRYFWTAKDQPFSQHPEIGLSTYSRGKSYQIDLGRLENHLYALNQVHGVVFQDNVQVQDVDLSPNGACHQVSYRQGQDDTQHTVSARWVIDATGRRRLLQRKLNLSIKSTDVHSAVWFRVKGRLDVTDFVPQSEVAWHQRTPNNNRYYATNHLLGHGYWIWLIPLSSGHTSIGIVAAEKFHPLVDYITPEKAMAWLAKHQPALHRRLQAYEMVDFLKIRDYSVSSKQVFSAHRWACTGNAALFSDPFYSPGLVLIGYTNSIITKMIALDKAAQLTPEHVRDFNNFIISTNNSDRYLIQSPYHYFNHSSIWSVRFLWAMCTSLTLIYPQMFNSIYLDPQKSKTIQKLTTKYGVLTLRMENLFKEWVDKTQGCFKFDFIDYFSVAFINDIYKRSIKTYQDFDDVLDHYRRGLERIEELAQVIFLLAVQDTMPDKMAMFSGPTTWLNAWAIGLNPEKWEPGGLFRPQTSARDLNEVRGQIQALYQMN